MNHRETKPQDRGFRPTIVPIGGFFGAGKTSLIVAAARLLHGRGVKAAAVLNDQGAELVDPSFVEANGIPAGQVAGGCFCCRSPVSFTRPRRCATTCRRSSSRKPSAVIKRERSSGVTRRSTM